MNLFEQQFNDKRFAISSAAMKEPERKKIESDIEKFLANGGKIEVLESGKNIAHSRAGGSGGLL